MSSVPKNPDEYTLNTSQPAPNLNTSQTVFSHIHQGDAEQMQDRVIDPNLVQIEVESPTTEASTLEMKHSPPSQQDVIDVDHSDIGNWTED